MNCVISLLIFFTGCVVINSQSSLDKWLDSGSNIFSVPIKYFIHLENNDPIFSKVKRSVTEGIKTEETFISNAKIITSDGGSVDRSKRTSDKTNNRNNKHGPNLNVKAGLRYHHQQRHPNGSVSGSYATLDPKGLLQVMHYVSDDRGYREYPELGELGSQASAQNQYPQYQQKPTITPFQASPKINIVTNSDVGNQAINLNQNNNTKNLNNRRDINPIGNENFHFVPNIASPYNVPSQADVARGASYTPILNSAVNSVGQFGPRSPLFHKYYRPSPEEVQRSYEYHRMRSLLDPAAFRPPEANNIPDVVRDKPMELSGIYNEHQTPYQVRYHDDTPAGYYVYNTPVEDTQYYNTPQYAPPQVPIDIQSPVPPPQELYPRQPPQNYYAPPLNQQFQQPYPENVPAQPPLYFQAFDQQAFPPLQDTYPPAQQGLPPPSQDAFPPGQQAFPPPQTSFPSPNAYVAPVPYLSNTATINQPYPNSVPIYEAPAPPNIPTYSQPPPNSIPIYNQPLPPINPTAYSQPPQNNIPVYNQPPPSNVYYASGSSPQPKSTSTKTS